MRTFFTALLFLTLPGLACAQYRGDVPLGETINFTFNTIGQDGAPITMGGTPEIVVYEEGNTTPITSADALAEDFGSVTGLHNVEITATSGNGFEAGKWYDCVIAGTTPTADSVSIAGRTVGTFRVLAAETVAGLQATDVAGIGGSTAAATTLEEGLNASGVYQVLYVDPNVAGGDSDARDKANADADTNSALALIDGDIGGLIYRSAGTETGNTVVSKSNVTIQGVAGAIYDATSGASMSVQEDNVTLIGLELDDLTVGTVTGTRLIQCTITGTITGSANIDIQDCTINGTYYPSISLMADAIKDKTDSLTFTVAGELDANVLSVEGADATDTLEQSANDGLVDNSYLETQLAAILVADIDDTAGSIGKVLADTLARSPSSAAITNINTVFETDFASAYNTTLDRWNSNLLSVEGTAPSAGGLLDAADIEAAADAAIATYFGTAGDGLTGIPTSGIADAVWDEVITTGHATANSAAVLLVDVPTTSEFEARTKATADYFDPATDNVRLGSILGRTLTETNADDLGDAFVNFFDVDTPAKTINDVGVSGSGLTKADIRDALFTDAFDITTTSDGSAIGRILDGDTDGSFDWSQADDAIQTVSEIVLAGSNVTLQAYNIINSGTHGNAALKTLIDNMQTDVDGLGTTLGAAGAGLTAIPWNAAWDTEVQTAATAALDAYDPPTKAEMDTGFNSTLQLNTSYNFTNGSGAEAGATFQIRTP